jgi:hypothetical protein
MMAWSCTNMQQGSGLDGGGGPHHATTAAERPPTSPRSSCCFTGWQERSPEISKVVQQCRRSQSFRVGAYMCRARAQQSMRIV